MTTISIMPECTTTGDRAYRAVAGQIQSVGKTPGEALDAVTAQLSEAETSTVVVVQSLRPDHFFTAAQQQRLAELMQRWRTARDAGQALPPEEQAKLDTLVEAQLRGAAARAAFLLRQQGR
ncbi:MAG TPA: hypothetical protein VKA46_01905 [Gemmataceae bacterium]|nr:hypothetical protein [Gemmataceae bacterium]